MEIDGDRVLNKALQEVLRLETINIKQGVVIEQYENELADLKIKYDKLQKEQTKQKEVKANESKSTNIANGQEPQPRAGADGTVGR